MTARKLTELIKKAVPGPAATRVAPASIGPIRREALNWVEFKVTALSSTDRGTSSLTNACQAGRLSPADSPTSTDMAT